MKYIPDKNLYSAVMFALKMCPNLQMANDSKVDIAANYYHVNSDDVFKIVKQELWNRAVNEAKGKESWESIYNPLGKKLLGTGIGNNYVLICPKCGEHYACHVDDPKLERLFVSQCKCGFVDKLQREVIRKDIFDRLKNNGGLAK